MTASAILLPVEQCYYYYCYGHTTAATTATITTTSTINTNLSVKKCMYFLVCQTQKVVIAD